MLTQKLKIPPLSQKHNVLVVKPFWIIFLHLHVDLRVGLDIPGCIVDLRTFTPTKNHLQATINFILPKALPEEQRGVQKGSKNMFIGSF